MPTIRAILFLLFQTISLIVWALLFTAIGPFLPFKKRYWFAMRWPAMNIAMAKAILGIRYQVIGLENLPSSPVVLLSKHESAWETMFYPYYFEHQMCFVLKRELLMLPFFGWSIAMLRMIAINRSKGGAAFTQVLDKGSKALLEERRWVVFFPEGTRALPGKHIKFKTGGARLAVATNTPVLPIAMNSGDVWPRKSFIKKPGVITVSIGPPLLPDGEDATTLTTKAETWIREEMRRISPHRPTKGHE
jgi:1-acyl-sn-glycerol-3-phosphate acyltransferase